MVSGVQYRVKGEALRQLAEAAGLKLHEVARKAGVSEKTFREYWRADSKRTLRLKEGAFEKGPILPHALPQCIEGEHGYKVETLTAILTVLKVVDSREILDKVERDSLAFDGISNPQRQRIFKDGAHDPQYLAEFVTEFRSRLSKMTVEKVLLLDVFAHNASRMVTAMTHVLSKLRFDPQKRIVVRVLVRESPWLKDENIVDCIVRHEIPLIAWIVKRSNESPPFQGNAFGYAAFDAIGEVVKYQAYDCAFCGIRELLVGGCPRLESPYVALDARHSVDEVKVMQIYSQWFEHLWGSAEHVFSVPKEVRVEKI